MNAYHVFYTKDKYFRISVLKTFLTVCPDPENYTAHELNSKYAMFAHLHHPTEPAVINFKRNVYEYWKEGKSVIREFANELSDYESKLAFNDKLDRLLDENSTPKEPGIYEILKNMKQDNPDEYAKKLLDAYNKKK